MLPNAKAIHRKQAAERLPKSAAKMPCLRKCATKTAGVPDLTTNTSKSVAFAPHMLSGAKFNVISSNAVQRRSPNARDDQCPHAVVALDCLRLAVRQASAFTHGCSKRSQLPLIAQRSVAEMSTVVLTVTGFRILKLPFRPELPYIVFRVLSENLRFTTKLASLYIPQRGILTYCPK
jgi:hypothetical protein